MFVFGNEDLTAYIIWGSAYTLISEHTENWAHTTWNDRSFPSCLYLCLTTFRKITIHLFNKAPIAFVQANRSISKYLRNHFEL